MEATQLALPLEIPPQKLDQYFDARQYIPKAWRGKIQHLDCDNRNISVETLSNPELGKVPATTFRKHGPITSVNPLAKKLGIKTAMRIEDAKAIAKEKGKKLILVEDHLQKYAKISAHFEEICRSQNPNVFPYGRDETFDEIFIDWSEYSPLEALKGARETVEKARKELGLRITSCLGPSPFLVKIGTNQAKPNGFLYLPFGLPGEETIKFFWPLPVEEIHGVGEKRGWRLRRAGFETIGDLSRAPLANLTGPFKIVAGTELYYLSRGIDIIPFPWIVTEPQKTISHSLGPYEFDPKRTYFLDFEEVKLGFRLLAIKIAQEMEEEVYTGTTVEIALRIKKTQEWTSKQKKVKPPFHDKQVIINLAEKLLPSLFTQETIDHISLRIINLQKDRSQLRLF